MKRRLGSRSVRFLVAFAAGSVCAFAMLGALPALAQSTTPAQTATATQTFTDIRGDEWFAEAVHALAAAGIVEGRQDGSYGPEDSLTRAQMAVFLARVLGLPESTGEPFIDVTEHDWFAGAVGALYQRRLIYGTSAFVFSPNEPVSRQQAVTMIMRAWDFFAVNDPESAVGRELPGDQAAAWLMGFRDRLMIGPDHAVSVANAYRLGVIDSGVDGWFFPQLNLSRAQMAVMLYRAFLQPVEARNVYPVELPAVSAYAKQSVGSEGSLVSFLETRLTALHYPCGPVDGVYDYRTKDAVMAFEKVERLKRDGAVGAEVWQRIFSAQTPTPRQSLAGTRSEVDLTRQVLFMITDNRVWEIVHVSTGRLGTRTGHHVIGAKYEGWVRCVTLEGEMYYPSYIVSKTAIHGYRSVPPYPASHGCVRVPMWMAVELYNQLPTGTPVDVYY
jgi:peptidoglycan hydrolase-like protein with peptidoglycan-binding domain